MAQDTARAGIDTYVLYGTESTYGTKASSIATHFGIVQSITPSNRNGLLQIRGFKGSGTSGRDLIKALGGKFETTVSVEFQPQHFDWMQYVLGSRTGAGSSGDPYIYTGSDSLTPITIATNLELGTTDRVWYYLGCKVNSCTIRSNFGEPVSITLDIMGADIDQATTLETMQALDSADVYTFSGSAIEWPNATPITNIIDSFELTIGNNIEILYGLGYRTGRKAKEKQREYGLRITLKTENNTYATAFLGESSGVGSNPTEVATVEFNFAGGTNHTANFLFSNVTLDEWNDAQTYGEVVPEELAGVAESLQVTETQTA